MKTFENIGGGLLCPARQLHQRRHTHDIAIEDQVTLETMVGGIPAALVKGQAWLAMLRMARPGTSRFRPSTRYGVHDGRYRHYGQYRLRLVPVNSTMRFGSDHAVCALPGTNWPQWIAIQRHQPDDE